MPRPRHHYSGPDSGLLSKASRGARWATLLLAFLAAPSLSGCGKKEEPAPAAEAPAPPASDAPAGEASAAPAQPDPHADPHGPGGPMADPPMVVRTAQGKIELTIDGTPQRLDYLPFGRNAAVWIEKNGISRVTIGGSETDAGTPTFSITVSGIRLDDVDLPVTVFGGNGGKPGTPAARITWQVGEKRVYRSLDPEGDGAKDTKVVLESYADGRVEGSFTGKLVMGKAELDPPLQVRGTFDVSLRLNGVAPNPAGS